MKKIILSSIVLLSVISCKKELKNNVNDLQNASKTNDVEFKIDSVKVSDSIDVSKTLTVKSATQILVFPSIKEKSVLDSIYKNAQLTTTAFDKNSLQELIKTNTRSHLEQSKKENLQFGPDFKQTWDEDSAMKMVSNNNHFLTLKYFGGGYTGGAHGYYFENYKTFDLLNNKTLQQEDVFKNPKDEKWSKILMEHFTNKDQKEMLLEDKILLNNNFYFDDKQITFVYNQFEITAYAAGVVYISIPFSILKNDLKESFLQRLNSK